MLDKFLKKLEKVINIIISLALSILVFTVTFIAFRRYIFSNTPQWGEPLALLLMVWFSILASAMGVIKNIHLRMSVMDSILPKKYILYFEHASNILWIILSILAVVYGVSLTILSGRNILTGLNIPASAIYISIPIFGIIVGLTSLNKELILCKQQ
ncbi:MAG: TRAP transporter small permease subunit [Tissierellia bacterium]|nr:TRAP transporter small permease subunit [Tissierellia bacterium]